MDLVLEWQRLRRMEKMLIEFKSMCFAPCVSHMTNGQSLVHYSATNDEKRNMLLTEILTNIRSRWMPDSEDMTKIRNKGEEV